MIDPVKRRSQLDLRQLPTPLATNRAGHEHRIMPGDDVHHAIHRPVVSFSQGRGAPSDNNLEVRLLPEGSANETTSLGVRLIGDGARVDHQDVGIGRPTGSRGATGLRLLAHPLRVVLVRLTTERVVVDAHEE